MKYRIQILMGLALVVVALPAHAQSTNIGAIMARMQEIISEMQALQTEFAELSSSVNGGDTSTDSGAGQPSGSVLGAATSVLQEEAVYGNTNDTITKIQTLLATDPLIYPEGTVSGFFGPKTQEAIRNLQARFGMDPVGVVGPSTSALLMEYFVAYPGGVYPDDVLSTRPTVVTDQPTTPDTDTEQPTTGSNTSTATPIDEIYLTRDDSETVIRVVMKNGDATGLAIGSTDEDDITEAVADKLGLSEAQVAAALDMSVLKPSRGGDYDEDEAEDMIEDAEDAIEEAEDAIDEADDVDGDTDEAEELLEEAEELLEEAEEAFDDEDYEDAYELAEEAEELAEDAIDEAEDAAEIDEDMAEDMIEDAEDAIDDADDAIDAARADGEDTDEAEELLEEAEDALDDAEDAFDDGDWEDAYEEAKDALELAEEAEDEV